MQPPAIPDHELLRVIGRGAYGEVWLARHRTLGTLRAVKVVRRADFEDERPFRREFEGIRRYEPISRSHPNLVAILHVGGDDAAFFYVMELADPAEPGGSNQCSVTSDQSPTPAVPAPPGSSLITDPLITEHYSPRTLRSELKSRGHAGADEAIALGCGLAGALAHLHAHGLVHRDVKPSNVIFAGGVPKLADLGLVTAVGDSRSFVGTEGYIPPEGPAPRQPTATRWASCSTNSPPAGTATTGPHPPPVWPPGLTARGCSNSTPSSIAPARRSWPTVTPPARRCWPIWNGSASASP